MIGFTRFSRILAVLGGQLLVTCVALLGPNAHAAPSCASVFSGTTTLRDEFIRVGADLRSRAQHVDKTKTHLEALRPILLRTIQLTERAFAKSDINEERRALVREVLTEAATRASSGHITYEYAYYLPYRISFLMEMTPNQGPNPSFSMSPVRYVTHANFMELVKESHAFVERMKPPFNSIIEYTRGFDDFPHRLFFPFPGNLSVPTTNRLGALDEWPIGVGLLTESIDGDVRPPSFLPSHDVSHAYQSIGKSRPTSASYLRLKKAELAMVDWADALPERQRRIQHQIHFVFFHEFTAEMRDVDWNASAPALRDVFLTRADRELKGYVSDSLLGQIGGYQFIRDEMIRVAPGITNREIVQRLREYETQLHAEYGKI